MQLAICSEKNEGLKIGKSKSVPGNTQPNNISHTKTLEGICGEMLHLNYCERIIFPEAVLSFYQPPI